jgi:hypothetical protein
MATETPRPVDGPIRSQVREYVEKGLEPRQIALLMDVSIQAIYLHLKALGLSKKDERETWRQERAS